ncbi:NAD(P)/FAD-dependent oxidoreductase [Actinomadura sp. DC4]|uniref:FAD/NAD(P)-dependent oxidoreductase n=1 Tax=Actinomadura sp. DC4 TaxID=3055069 RepID=UPI0025B10720|nr:NAD(P)/FAD-dependent oxidoreductase [Actinomadura sp. DC4]MDN3358724.1 NAD(P)/FAD-dependent oxidoreductase [Actinomadura sp. DC4]
MNRHVVVVGAGPAGLAAAFAARRAGAGVTLLDAADQAGGQYHRMPLDAYATAGPRPPGWRPESAVWALERHDENRPPRVHVVQGPDGAGRVRHTFEPDALVLATGAFDRVLPFPGWELPGVFTAGAAQALIKGERLAVGDRPLVAGSGPFLLPVAAALLQAGARVRAVLEANPAGTLLRGWAAAPWRPAARTGKGAELAAYAALLARRRVPYRTGRAVVEARGDGRVEEAVTARLRADWSVVPGTEQAVAVDAVCVTHGFGPQLELPVAAGCALRDGFVRVDGDQATSSPGVYAAGEVTGIAGAPAARAEGLIAGWAAAGGAPAALRTVRRHRDRGRAFAVRLAAAHPIGAAWAGWLRPDTVVCRCEETTCAAIRRAATEDVSAPALKLATRAGLGPCQARMCGPTVAELTGGRTDPHRRPIAQPIRLSELADDEENPDEHP